MDRSQLSLTSLLPPLPEANIRRPHPDLAVESDGEYFVAVDVEVASGCLNKIDTAGLLGSLFKGTGGGLEKARN